MLGFILQVRTGSTRLPNKVLLPFAKGDHILGQVVAKLRNFFPDVPMIIATTTNEADAPIVDYCEENGLTCFRGSENDVLARTLDAANAHGIEDIIRVCSDNPFLHPKFIGALINDTSHADYVSYQVDDLPTIRTHYGLFVERVKRSALEKAIEMNPDAFYREHVTNFIYGNPNDFSIQWVDIEDHLNKLEDLRLTIDDPDDFALVSGLYEDIVSEDTSFDLEELRSHLLAHPEKLEKMARIKEKYSK